MRPTSPRKQSEPEPPHPTPTVFGPGEGPLAERGPSLWARARERFVGSPRDPLDPHVFHQISLVAFLAWVGLGADGLSSSCYGPAEAYLALGQHHFLAVILAALMAITVFVISVMSVVVRSISERLLNGPASMAWKSSWIFSARPRRRSHFCSGRARSK